MTVEHAGEEQWQKTKEALHRFFDSDKMKPLAEYLAEKEEGLAQFRETCKSFGFLSDGFNEEALGRMLIPGEGPWGRETNSGARRTTLFGSLFCAKMGRGMGRFVSFGGSLRPMRRICRLARITDVGELGRPLGMNFDEFDYLIRSLREYDKRDVPCPICGTGFDFGLGSPLLGELLR